jgi:hypothetical protein
MTFVVGIDEFKEEHFDPIFSLFSSYFPTGDRLLTRDYTLWLYANNPFGKAKTVVVCEGERWVGFMAMIPVSLTKAGETLLGYYVVNVLVHPEFHGKHLFGRMIKAAMASVESEGAALLGHPNDLALKSWQRARMHFHEPLRPSIAIPNRWINSCSSRLIESGEQLASVRSQLLQLQKESCAWRVAACPEYLAWRYLKHPAIDYKVQIVEKRGIPIGAQISKPVKLGMHLLLDQFVPEDDKGVAASTLPIFTICFLPDSVSCRPHSGIQVVPLKKRIPFFMTRANQPVDSADAACIGLSPSDF